MKKIIAAILAAAMVFSVAACGAPKKEETAQKEVLKVGLSADYPPFEYFAEGDDKNPVGIDVDLANYIADALGMELQITNMSFDGLIGSLPEGKFDLVISAMTINPERECLFSDPYYFAEQALLVKKGNEDLFADTDAMKGAKIGGQMGAIQEELAKKYAGEDTAMIVNNVQDMVMMVNEGKLDGMIAEIGVALSAVAKNDNLAIASVQIPYEDNGLGVCAAKDNQEIIDKINPIIKEINDKKLMEEWAAKHFTTE